MAEIEKGQKEGTQEKTENSIPGEARTEKQSGGSDRTWSMTPEEYSRYVKEVTPVHNTPANMAKAFLVGGMICGIGQCLTSWFLTLGIEKEAAGTWTSIALVGAAILLTGLNWFGSIVKFGGAGALVPITGFANSMVSPAIEYKKEGQVFGIGCKIFTIAGPVILYGIFASWIAGILYYLLDMAGVYWA